MRKIGRQTMVSATLLLLALSPSIASAESDLLARLTGFQEVPSVSSAGRGSFTATLAEDKASLAYRLEYSGLEGAVQQAHIHFAQRAVNGGIVAFLCTNLGNGPTGTPACPESGAVEGTISAGNMVDTAAGQGLSAGEFAEFLGAIARGVTYANVHTAKHPGGEIRGQIRVVLDVED